MAAAQIQTKTLSRFFRFATEREEIRLRRAAGGPAPWTQDQVLQQFRFCNIYREDDATTVWFRDSVRQRLWVDPKVLVATVAFRWFNYVPTGRLILPWLVGGWDREGVESVLRPLQARGQKLFTGAYLIKSPPGKDKLTGILDCIDAVDRGRGALLALWDPTLEQFHEGLMRFPYLGPFMAYEVVTDLRHTSILCKASDVLTWASPGPGAARGIGWLIGSGKSPISPKSTKALSYTSKKSRGYLIALMREVLDASREQWPAKWRRWEMREVEHVLCEYDKFRRGHAGQVLKRRFECR